MTNATRKWFSRLAASCRRARRPHARLRLAAKRIVSALILLLPASPVQAITATFGDIEITPQPTPKGNSSHGYFEYVFRVFNKSEERPHLVSLALPFEKEYANGDLIRELRRTVQVGAKETVHVSLLQPDHPPLRGSDAVVSIDGRRQEREVPFKPNESVIPPGFRSGRFPPTSGIAEALVLLGKDVKSLPKSDPPPGGSPMMLMPGGSAIPPSLRAPGMTRPPMKSPQGGGPPVSLPLGLSPPRPPEVAMPPAKPGLPPHGYQFVTAEDTWSDNWLAYSRYDGIIVTAAELNGLPGGVRTALWQYVETGGALLVLGRTDLRGVSAVAEMTKDKEWQSVQAGFGLCRVSPDAKYEDWNAKYFGFLASDWRNAAAPWSTARRSTYAANGEFPVIDDLGIPVKGLFVLMFLFTLGIGPINVLVLSRLKRRIWLLWTAPAISLFTCLTVLGFMLLSEGWQGELRSETLTLLDETTHRATTIGWTGVYSPLTPGEGLHFSYETEVVPQRYFEGRRGGARSCSLDWSEDQHFASGWVEARVPALFKVRKSELRRERIALQREPGGHWSIVNGLGAAIGRFWYADGKGQIHMAENVAPGARTLLTQTETECQVVPKSMQSILSGGSWMSSMQQLAAYPQHYLRPGAYLAEVNDSPFLEQALRNARTRKLHALILGTRRGGE